MKEPDFLMGLLFDAFNWFDESLQRSIQAQNIPTLSRSQSMIMIWLAQGVRRPSELARQLRVSRQAIQKTLSDLEAKGYLRLVDDPDDRRAKLVRLSRTGRERQASAWDCLRLLEQELRVRLGAGNVSALIKALQADWGKPHAVESRKPGQY